MNNKNLNAARMNKNDEFYTQLCDIENELQHYKDHFCDKIVYCNCDDPHYSNFFKYFVIHFNELHLQKLICTCYDGNPIDYTKKQLFDYRLICGNRSNRVAYKIEVTHIDNDVSESMSNTELFEHIDAAPERLKGNGDFRSPECIEYLKQCDIVVGNPPFSMFREFTSYMMEYRKKFLIIGNINSITYKEVFSHIQCNEIWLGVCIGRKISGFIVPEYYDLYGSEVRINKNGERIVSTNDCLWLTNLHNCKRDNYIKLSKSVTTTKYYKYVNYDAINVDKTCDIPYDCACDIGVPITFLSQYNPSQFEIISFRKGNDGKDLFYIDQTGNIITPYFRILIRRKQKNLL